MYLANGMRGILRQFNRDKPDEDQIYNDRNYKDVPIKLNPYNSDKIISFGEFTHPEATGYYIVPRYIDVKEGDQIVFLKNRFNSKKINEFSENDLRTILKVKPKWLYNHIEYYILAIK